MKTMNGRKKRAAILAILLIVAMTLTGTFAWRSISQRTTNEFLDVRNPGGRIHDDFNGLENKDIYAENFTDVEHGMPVFVRVRLYEYMETGIDSGVKRDQADRKATPVLAGTKINDLSTWHLHNPATADDLAEDPFHNYWKWDMDGGSTAYLPTFNKNKDSLSVDVNGTYEGIDGLFNADDPYSDYKPYKVGDADVTQDAFYDVDDNLEDEYDPATDEPGAGGIKDGEQTGDEKPNYKAVEETHKITETLNSTGILSMKEWKELGSPVCNKWVYDEDGWFYWPEPVMPQTATGLLLNKVTQVSMTSEKCYYAINVVGQFATANDWGNSAAGDGDPAKGFFADGFTPNAQALLDQAAQVKVVTADDGTQKWYMPMGHNVYKPITDDEGTLGAAICAGEDLAPGTDDDPTELVEVDDPIILNDVDYGHYFLKSTAAGSTGVYCYRVNTGDLGTKSDTYFWLTADTFPSGDLITKPVTGVKVTAAGDAVEVGNDNTLQFTADVTVADAAMSQDVTWKVSGKKGTTSISDSGLLTVAGENVDTVLTVTATSKLDPRVSGKAIVTVVGKPVTVTVSAGATTVRAGSHLGMSATVNVDGTEDPSASVKWSVTKENGSAFTGTGDSAVAIDTDGKLTVGKDVAKDTKIHVFATYELEGKTTKSAAYEVTVLEAGAVSVTPSVEVDGTVVTTLNAGTTTPAFKLNVTDADSNPVTALTKTWSVETKAPGTFALREVDPDTVVSIDPSSGVLTIGKKVAAGTGIIVTCEITYDDPENEGSTLTASGSATFTVAGPDKVEITNTETSVPQNSTLQMTANVTKDGKAFPGDDVTWSMTGNTKASIDANTGLLTVNDEDVGKTLSIVATSVVDGKVKSIAKSLNVISAGPATVEVTSSKTSVVQGSTNTLTLTAKVKDASGNDYSNQNVTWSLAGDVTGTTLNVTGTGENNATLVVTWDEAQVGTDKLEIIATSAADSNIKASKKLSVTYAPPVKIVVTSNKNSGYSGDLFQFTATVWCDEEQKHKYHNQTVIWSSTESTAPNEKGEWYATGWENVTITATSVDDPNVKGTKTVGVSSTSSN